MSATTHRSACCNALDAVARVPLAPGSAPLRGLAGERPKVSANEGRPYGTDNARNRALRLCLRLPGTRDASFGLYLAPLCIAAGLALGAASGKANDLGRHLFEPCRACHALDPAAQGMAGPSLAGLIGRKVAGDPQFDYSPVLRQAGAEGQVWTAAKLETFLADPEAMFPGMWMTARGIANATDRRALIGFLADPQSR